MADQEKNLVVSRRDVLKGLVAAAGCGLLPESIRSSSVPWRLTRTDEAFLDDLERQGCLFFWDQASPRTGQVLDRARNDLNGRRDSRRIASIASTGFGLTALCIADHRGYLPHAQILNRVKTTLRWHLNWMPEVHGFFYHFTDVETGQRWANSEISPIDTAILLCGMLTAKAYFAVSDRFGFDRIDRMTGEIATGDYYEGLALQKARDSLENAQRELAQKVIANGSDGDLAAWEAAAGGRVAATAEQVEKILSDRRPSMAKVAVAASSRPFRSMVASGNVSSHRRAMSVSRRGDRSRANDFF